MGAEAFQRIEDRQDRQLSRLAHVSLRSLATVLITVVLAEAGGRRWCELATVQADAAVTFMKLFPGTRFVCVHRSCTDVIASGLQAHPWSIANAEFGRYPAAYPGNNAAALAAYWVSCTEDLLAFEENNGAACIRLRYEDLVTDETATLTRLVKFLEAERTNGEPLAPQIPAGSADAEAEPGLSSAPVDAIPAGLRSRVLRAQSRLGYSEPASVTQASVRLTYGGSPDGIAQDT